MRIKKIKNMPNPRRDRSGVVEALMCSTSMPCSLNAAVKRV